MSRPRAVIENGVLYKRGFFMPLQQQVDSIAGVGMLFVQAQLGQRGGYCWRLFLWVEDGRTIAWPKDYYPRKRLVLAGDPPLQQRRRLFRKGRRVDAVRSTDAAALAASPAGRLTTEIYAMVRRAQGPDGLIARLQQRYPLLTDADRKWLTDYWSPIDGSMGPIGS